MADLTELTEALAREFAVWSDAAEMEKHPMAVPDKRKVEEWRGLCAAEFVRGRIVPLIADARREAVAETNDIWRKLVEQSGMVMDVSGSAVSGEPS